MVSVAAMYSPLCLEQCCPWERGAPVGVGFGLSNSKIFYVHKNLRKRTKEREEKKRKCIIGLLQFSAREIHERVGISK